ncbi:MAG: glutathione binding-like protein [Rhizobiaceae bacterium]|nr:glutathione binding-like protein [Rhizobiaceae bacterium]
MPALLYHRPFNCSLAVLIGAAEAGVEINTDLVVDTKSKALESGGSLMAINPLGQVSTMQLENGELLTETSACLIWVQSQSTTSFHVSHDDPRYFQMLRWLGFVATELHKQALRIIYYSEATDKVKDNFRSLVPARLALLDNHLESRDYMLGQDFTAADAYLTWFLLHAERAKVWYPGYANLEAYRDRVMARPVVARVIDADRAAMAQ